MAFDTNKIPVLSRDIIARNDENGMLLFQVHTDEMYFVPFATYYSFIAKCDGSQTIEEIITDIDYGPDVKEGEKNIDGFVQELLKRDIITLW